MTESSDGTRDANDFNDLPEPARAVAVQTFHELMDAGKSETEADEQARQLALNWLSERAPMANEEENKRGGKRPVG